MRADIEKAIVQDTLHLMYNTLHYPALQIISVNFSGYKTEDLDCKYCLHYGGKSKGCRIAECCCSDEKQQAAFTAAKIMEV